MTLTSWYSLYVYFIFMVTGFLTQTDGWMMRDDVPTKILKLTETKSMQEAWLF